ncbi:SAV_2336 N-terminal domain-related protein [Streptomyces sp. NPDC029004]|uniref:SAV_2336 N-terminal domain-related protein n=1 Tax=Streptomyces sp. NPDC029004 TaxID=3154490 RepID=UPI0033BFFE54
MSSEREGRREGSAAAEAVGETRSVTALAQALKAVDGSPPTGRELAELLWLTAHFQQDPATGSPSGAEPDGSPPRSFDALRPPPLPPYHPPAQNQVPLRTAGSQTEESASQNAGGVESGPAATLLAPAPPMIARPLTLQRALRPLGRRVPSSHAKELDETETAHRIAGLGAVPGIWLPVLKPKPERWLHLRLVFDAGPTTAMWLPLVQDLRTSFGQTGIFRTVDVWHLGANGRIPPQHLTDARTTVLVISDCMGPPWREGPAGRRWYRTLRGWASALPVAIIQPLPERLWHQTAFPPLAGSLRARAPGAANSELDFSPYDPAGERAAEDIPVPVLEPSAAWLANWASMIATGGTEVPGSVGWLRLRPACPNPSGTDVLSSLDRIPPEELVLRFRAVASAQAFRLATHLAVGSAHLPVMRLVQAALEDRPQPQQLAEVVLSGMLKTVPGPVGSYEFRPGVREVLLGMLPQSSLVGTRQLLEDVGSLISERAGAAPGEFRAEVATAGGDGVTGGEEPFALVSEETVQRLGGSATELEPPPEPEPELEFEPSEKPSAWNIASGERSAAAVGDIGSLLIGEPTSEVHETPETPPPTVEPVVPAFGPVSESFSEIRTPVARIPDVPIELVGRVRESSLLAEALDESFTPVVQVLSGVGGAGKSVLAAHVANLRLRESRLIWWITADSPLSVDAGLFTLAQALDLSTEGTADAVRERAVHWLATHEDWLLVLDDVTDPADVRDLLVRLPHGRFLITTRHEAGWTGVATGIHRLGSLERHDAVALFNRVLGAEASYDLASVADLCRELGELPLAVTMAAAYCRETRTPPHDYLMQLSRRRGTTIWDDHLTTVWQISLRLLGEDPLPATVLRSLAWYAPEGIPQKLLMDLAPAADVARTLDELSSLGFIDVREDLLSVHRLVQSFARTPDAADPDRRPDDIAAARALATDALVRAFPHDLDDPGTWPVCRALVPHIGALVEHAPAHTDTDSTSMLLNQAAVFLLEQGAMGQATVYLERSLAGSEQTLGADHPSTVTSLTNLAYAYDEAGDLARAAELYERSLAARTRILGADHPDTLHSRQLLARTHQKRGNPEAAVSLLESVVSDSERVLGPDHPNTLAARNGLAQALAAAGEVEAAIALLSHSLADRVRVLGEDHPHVLASRNNLAQALADAGHLTKAIALYEQNLHDHLRVLGEEHPQSLLARNNLAYSLYSLGRTDEAIPLLEESLEQHRRVLGEAHPQALTAQGNLGLALHSAGATDRAVPLLERTVVDRTRVLGPDHPDTLIARISLGDARMAMGATRQALAEYRSSHTDCVRLFGDDHPLTRAARERVESALSR